MRAAEVDGDYEWETGRVITRRSRARPDGRGFAGGAGPLPRAVRLGRDAGGGRRGGDRARGDRDDRLADARHRPVAPAIQAELLHRHFDRKHGATAYYGQPPKAEVGG
jgi:hypothetical protein